MSRLIRIGDKLINQEKIMSIIDQILELREAGLSQQEVANRLGLERPFISRLEGLGEVRQGSRLAVIGFPVLNKKEIENLLQEMGVDFFLLMTDQERWKFIQDKSGLELLNTIMDLTMHIKTFDVVIVIGSDLRIKIAQALLDKEVVVPVYIGESPIEGDRRVDPEDLRQILLACREKKITTGSGRRR